MSVYTIKKGNHYASGLHFGVHFGITEQRYKVKFSKECIYTPDNENDWNKLCGWSYGLHHNNSIRVCWRPQVVDGLDFNNQESGRIELCTYVYENGIRKTSVSTMAIEVDKDFEFILKYDISSKSVYFFPVTDVWERVGLDYSTKPSWGYRLFPYIGGDNVAVEDTDIELERL